jgi:hypothetical protein
MNHTCGCATFGPGPHPVDARHPNVRGCEHAEELDVERLERALGNLYEQKWPHVGSPTRLATTVFGAYAEDIAAEYAALQAEPARAEEGAGT